MPPLKSVLKSLDGLPQELQGLYTKVGDDFVLDVDDQPFKAKLAEFRDTNIGLSKTAAALEASLKKYEGIDPEKAQEALEAIHKMEASEEGKLLKDGKIDEVFSRRMKKIAAEHEQQVASLQRKQKESEEKATQLRERITRMIRHEKVNEAVSQVGQLRPGALRDVLNRADSIFRIEGDNFEVIKAVDEHGNVRTNKKGDPLTMEEWAASLVTEADYLFEKASGGGARSQVPNRGVTGGTAGKIIVDRNDPAAKGRYAKEIMEGTAIVR